MPLRLKRSTWQRSTAAIFRVGHPFRLNIARAVVRTCRCPLSTGWRRATCPSARSAGVSGQTYQEPFQTIRVQLSDPRFQRRNDPNSCGPCLQYSESRLDHQLDKERGSRARYPRRHRHAGHVADHPGLSVAARGGELRHRERPLATDSKDLAAKGWSERQFAEITGEDTATSAETLAKYEEL